MNGFLRSLTKMTFFVLFIINSSGVKSNDINDSLCSAIANGDFSYFDISLERITLLARSTNRFANQYPWQQNHQSFDALYLQRQFFTDLYRKLINIESKHFEPFKIQTYSYVFHYPDIAENTTKNYGFRLGGELGLTDKYSDTWTAKHTLLQAYKNGNCANHNYHRIKFSLKSQLFQRTSETGVLEGNDRSPFLTPLTIAHPFSGWAGQFQPVT